MTSQPAALGAPAPDFELKDQHGQEVRLSQFRGARNVLLVFYPFAFTGVCTGELRAVRDQLPRFQNDDAQVLAVSCDTRYALRVFSERQGLDYPLLSDFWPHGATARAYGVFDDAVGVAVRGTFIIDRQGIVRWQVSNAIPDARDAASYAKILADL